MVNSSRTIGRDVTLQDKLSIFILDLFLFLLSAISTEQLRSITPVNSLTDCRSTLGPQLYRLLYSLYILLFFIKGLQIRIPNLSRSHIFVSELSTCSQYLPFLMNGCIWTLIMLSLSACGSVSLGVVLESCFAPEDVAPGPSILTRIL